MNTLIIGGNTIRADNYHLTDEDILNDEISIQFIGGVQFSEVSITKMILHGKKCGNIYNFMSKKYDTILDINKGALYPNPKSLTMDGIFVKLILSKPSNINKIKKKISKIFCDYKCLFYDPVIKFWNSTVNIYKISPKNKALLKFGCKFVDKEVSDKNNRETLAIVINDERQECKITADNIHHILIPGTKIRASYLINATMRENIAHIKFVIDGVCIDNSNLNTPNTIAKINWKKRKSIAMYQSAIIKRNISCSTGEQSIACSTFVLSNKGMVLNIASFI